MEPAQSTDVIRKETLLDLLYAGQPQVTQGDPGLERKLGIAAHVFDTWTLRGTCPAGLADRFLDGSMAALEAFVSCPAPARKGSSTGANASTATSSDCSHGTGASVQGATSGIPHSAWGGGHLDRRHASELSYNEFVSRYMAPNRPVLIDGAADNWRARRDWVAGDGGVALDVLEREFGDSLVWVTNTSRQEGGCGPRQELPLREYLAWWRRHQAGAESEVLYLKDWHFAAEFPDYGAYRLPHYFREDWLNEYHDLRRQPAPRASPACARSCALAGRGLTCESSHQRTFGENHREDINCSGPASAQHAVPAQTPCSWGMGDDSTGCSAACAGHEDAANSPECSSSGSSSFATSDYRFVYLGPAGSWTPLHADVLRSYSWSTNVCGRKLWRLLPPEHTHLLYDRFGREMAQDFEVDGADKAARFPNLACAAEYVIECIQEAGETMFVPSGWHHTVANLEDTLSINHNWLNGHNVHWAWALLRRERAAAEAAIEDCRETCSAGEFEALVQRNLAANSGLDYAGLAAFLAAIARRELATLADLRPAAEPQRAAEARHGPAVAASSPERRTVEACCRCSLACAQQEEPAGGGIAGHVAAGGSREAPGGATPGAGCLPKDDSSCSAAVCEASSRTVSGGDGRPAQDSMQPAAGRRRAYALSQAALAHALSLQRAGQVLLALAEQWCDMPAETAEDPTETTNMSVKQDLLRLVNEVSSKLHELGIPRAGSEM